MKTSGGHVGRDIRLVLADVDGSLVTQDKVLTPRAIRACEALGRAGVALAITSGRPPRGMGMLIEPLAIDTPVAGFNGGVLTHPDLSVIESHTLDRDAAALALKTILDLGLDAWLYTPDDWLVRDKDAPHVAREAWTVRFEARVVGRFSEADLAQTVKIVGVSDDLALVEKCEGAVRSALKDKASAARSQPYYLDVTHPQANKGAVVETLSRLMHIPTAHIATIGDMPNDTLMFARSGFAIAMGNASPQVQAKADAVTASNEEEGFAKAMETLILEPRREAKP